MQSVFYAGKPRRRSRPRRNYKLFRARVAERLVVYADPNNVEKLVIQHDYALKRMHRARISVPTASVAMRKHCFENPMENPVSTGGTSKWLGIAALAALGVFVVSQLVGKAANAQDDQPLASATGTNFPVP